MTDQIEFSIETANLTRWQKLKAWFAAIDETMNNDPQAEAVASIERLWQMQAELETRVSELERSIQSTT